MNALHSLAHAWWVARNGGGHALRNVVPIVVNVWQAYR